MATLTHVPKAVSLDATVKKSPQSVGPQDESVITKLKDEIWELWAVKTLENWFFVGKKLWQLRVARSKPGSGTFIADLAELGIPYWTAYRRINFYGEVMAGYDPTPVRLLQNAKDIEMWLVEDVVSAEQEALKKAADEKLKKRKAAIEAEHDQLQRDLQDKKKHTPEYRFWIYLPSLAKRKLFFEAWHKKLGHRRASALVVKVILNAANKHKGKRASQRRRG
jgi:hypothetical protein